MKQVRKLAAFSVVILAGTATGFSGQAEDDVRTKALTELSIEELMKIRITTLAAITPRALQEAPATVSVVTLEDMKAAGVTSISEALQQVPGLHVSRSSVAYSPKYLIRGISTSFNPQTLVMVNGIPVTVLDRGDRGQPGPHVDLLPIEMVSKIEVIRGPGSALYGADAFAGVINVVTKDTTEIGGSDLGARAGSFDTRAAWLAHGKEYGDLKVALMAHVFSTDGHRRILEEDAQTQLDRAVGTGASLAPGPVNLSADVLTLFLGAERGKLRARTTYQSRGNIGSGQGLAEALDPRNRRNENRLVADLTFHEPKLTRDFEFTARLSYFLYALRQDEYPLLFPPGADFGNGVFADGVIGKPEGSMREARLSASLLYTGIDAQRIRLGAGNYFGQGYRIRDSVNFTQDMAPRPVLTDVTGTPEVFSPDFSRSSVYGYLQHEWDLSETWSSTLGLRYDRFSDFGNTVNPRAGLVWKTTPELTAKFLYGRAFRAPSISELYFMNNPVVLGNPALAPERNSVYEVAWCYQPNERVRASLNIFYYAVTGMIDFIGNPDGVTATAQNARNQDGRGLEAEAKVRPFSQLFLAGHYSLTKAKDTDTGHIVPDYPKHRAHLRSEWTFAPKWAFDTQLNRVGRRPRETFDSRAELPGYMSVDLIVRRIALSNQLGLRVAVRNVLNANIREPSTPPQSAGAPPNIPNDLPQSPRNAYIEATYRF